MWRIQELKTTFIWLYLFNQTVYIPLNDNRNKFLYRLSFIPKLILIIVFFAQIITHTFRDIPQPTKNDIINKILIYSAITHFMTNLLTVFSTTFNPFGSKAILTKFALIIEYIESRWKMEIPIRAFEKRHRRKIMLYVVLQLFIIVLKLFSNPGLYSKYNLVLMGISFMYKGFIVFHITIFISLIGLIMSSLNMKIVKVLHDEPISRHSVVFLLRQFKLVHYKLPKIVKMINDEFGWILFVFMLEAFNITASSVSWVFVYMETMTKTRTLYFLRKSFSFGTRINGLVSTTDSVGSLLVLEIIISQHDS